MNGSEVTTLLENLGLTEYEAKTLASLFRLKETEAPEISRSAQVPKTRVYDVLDRLVKRGLIIEIYGRPKKYRVIDAEDVFKGLLNSKKNEIVDLEERIDTVKKQIEQVEVKTNDEFERVMKVKDKNDYIKILSQEIDTAEKSVLAFTELKKDHEVLRQSFKSAKAKKVDVRMLGKLDDTNKSIAKELSSHGVDIKHSDHSLSAFVIDDNKVILGLSDFSKDRPEYHFTIWQNHPDIANALKHYFNHVWNNVPVSKKK